MSIDNLISGFLGAVIGVVGAAVIAWFDRRHSVQDAARERSREWDLKRLTDTREQLHLLIAEAEAHQLDDVDAEAGLRGEIDRRPYPDNDVRVLGDEAQAILTELYRFSALHGEELEVRRAARILEDRVWRVTNELRGPVERGEPLKLVEVTLDAFPADVRRRFDDY